jgi:Cytochrome c7 and related cytochrome c
MSKKGRVLAPCWALVFLLCGTAARAEQGPGACGTCHNLLGGQLARPITEWNASVHRQVGVTCESCHGGDASVDVGNVMKLTPQEFKDRSTRSMSKSRDFVEKPSGKAMFAMCARCHANSVDRYASSIMGVAYLEGKGGPSCVACHNAHNNIIPAVPKVCEACHKDTTGFNRIDPMNVSEATINELSTIRIGLAEEKVKGGRPPLAPEFPEELDSYQIGLLAFAGVFIMFVIGLLIYAVLEKRR